jgi:uncharacterized protein YcbX
VVGGKLGYRGDVVTLVEISSYPVKSCRGIGHDVAVLTEAGLEHDREWMFVTPAGRFLTQRETPALAKVEVAIGQDGLRLFAAGSGEVSVSLNDPGTPRPVTVWRDRCVAFDQGDEVAAWATGLLGREVRLVRFGPTARRLSDPAWTGPLEADNRFSDGFPLLILSRASLDELNSRLPVPLPMNRFRPNLVFDGLPPFGEDAVQEFVSGGVRLRVVKPCTRCVITTTDQSSGVVDGEEPLRTLRTFRWNPQLRGVAFGQNAIVVEGAGSRLERGVLFSAVLR